MVCIFKQDNLQGELLVQRFITTVTIFILQAHIFSSFVKTTKKLHYDKFQKDSD